MIYPVDHLRAKRFLHQERRPFVECRDMEGAYDAWIREELRPNCAATFAPNRMGWSQPMLLESLNRLLSNTEKFRLGQAYYKRPLWQRMEGIFWTEKPKENRHTHAALRIETSHRGKTAEEVMAFMTDAWRRLVPSGTADIKLITDWRSAEVDLDWITYTMKGFASAGIEPVYASDFASSRHF